MKFRPVRGGLDEAMAEIQTWKTKGDLVRILMKTSSFAFGREGVEVVLKSQGFDNRIGWDSYLVLIDGVPVGYTDGVPPDATQP